MAGEDDPVKGTVAWFDVRRGFGFITPEDGGENLFVHHSAIKAMGFRSLSVGEAVEFVVSVGDNGRRRAVSVTGPGGSYIKVRKYFDGACYRCGEVGHMAMDCKSNVGCGRLGPCYRCGAMGHLAKECPDARIESSLPRSNVFKAWKLSDHVEEEIRTVFGRLYENAFVDSAEEEGEDEINDEDRELTSRVEQRNWAELPRDVLSVIFKKIAAVEILRSAQFVCRPWRQLSHEPELWRHVVVAMPEECMDLTRLESLAMLAADRSEGSLEKLHLEGFGRLNDEIIGYISDRATKLRSLRLISNFNMSATALAQAVRKFRLLEELEISFCLISAELLGTIGSACPLLKSFSLNTEPYPDYFYCDIDGIFDSWALAISTHMQQLRRLQLIGNTLTNTGLFAILDNCPNLQYLDIRRCLNINMDENTKKKCKKVKHLRLPKDSTADYEFNEVFDGYEDFFAELAPPLSYSYYDRLYDDYDEFDYFEHDGEISDMSYDGLFDFS